jgi:hypothetical protein
MYDQVAFSDAAASNSDMIIQVDDHDYDKVPRFQMPLTDDSVSVTNLKVPRKSSDGCRSDGPRDVKTM